MKLRATSTLFLIALACLAGEKPAQAADPDCVLSSSQPGGVDFGTNSGAALTQVGVMPELRVMARRSFTFTVTCARPRVFELRVDSPRIDSNYFRFGDRGLLKINLLEASIDGRPALLAQTGGTSTDDASPRAQLTARPGQKIAVGNGGALMQGTNLTVRFDLEAQVPSSGIRTLTRFTTEGLIQLL